MKRNNALARTGVLSVQSGGELNLLQCNLSAEELLSSLPNQHSLYDKFSASYRRSVTKERLEEFIEYYYQAAINASPIINPSISMVIRHVDSLEQLSDKFPLATVVFDRENSTVIEGFLVVSSLAILLGVPDPFNGHSASKYILDAKQKEYLLSINTQVSVYFNSVSSVSDSSIYKMFSDINKLDTRVYSQNISAVSPSSPLFIAARKLSNLLELETFGGVSELNKITKSESYITTYSTLMQTILATLGGKGVRVGKKLPTHLPDGTEITDAACDEALAILTPLMKHWLICLRGDFLHSTNGFHRSMQIWQSLGLVAFYLKGHTKHDSLNLEKAGTTLGQLDYRKTAAHWAHCDAFKKDSTNTYWINATGGGRTLRDKVASYFISLIAI